MMKFTKLGKRLKQNELPLLCDERVLIIVIHIYLQNQHQLHSIILMLGGFYTLKCFQLCNGNYIQGSGLEEFLKQTRVFEVKVVDSILNRTDYVRSLKVILILNSLTEEADYQMIPDIAKAGEEQS